MIGFHPSQFTITHAQYDQLLNFLKSQSITDLTNSAQTSSTYGFAMVNSSAQFYFGGTTSSDFVNNFTGNITYPSGPSSIDSKYSIFSEIIVDRQAFASKDGILDTRATDHIVHSITHLTTITFVINTVVYLPIRETTLDSKTQ